MKTWQFAVMGLACLAVAGCRIDPRITALERENRMLEDEIYRLRWMIEDYQAEIESCPVENGSSPWKPGPGEPGSKRGLGGPDGPVPLDVSGGKPISPDEFLDKHKVDDPPQSPEVIETPDPPQGPSGPSLPVPHAPDRAQLEEASKFRSISTAAPPAPTDGAQVARLLLNRALTGGYDADSLPGDEGVTAVIEPRDAQGRWIDAPADVSVVVLDPAIEGQAARVARWDFTAGEMADLFRNTGLGRGIELKMPWPAAPPQHNKLHLYVRYTTSDGRKLEADMPIQVALPGERSPGWVPSEPKAPKLQASRPTESRQSPSNPAARIPTSPSPRAADRPAAPRSQRPLWAPNRR